MAEIKQQRLEYLDGIRGIAALIVVLNHFRNAFIQKLDKNVCWVIIDNFYLSGAFCVQVFFVLSGFVLAYNSLSREGFLAKQWTKRIYRLIVPVFITSLLYFSFSMYDFFYFKQLHEIHDSNWVAHHWILKFDFIHFVVRMCYDFFLFSDWQFIWNINSSLWTIPIEFYWSYLLFVIIGIINKFKSYVYKNFLFLTYSILILVFYRFIGNEFSVLFLAGSFLAINFKSITTFINVKIVNVLMIVFILILTYLVDFHYFSEFIFLNIKWTTIMAIFYVFIAIRSQFIQKIFSFQITKWLGRISFPLYLLHLLVIGSLSSKLYILFPVLRADWGLMLLLIITLGCSILISHLFTVYIDEPLMKLFDKYYKKITNAK